MFFFLRHLFSRQALSPLPLPTLHPDQLFRVEISEGLPENALLQVPRGQSVCFFQDKARSAVFPPGKHSLTGHALAALDTGAALMIVILQHETNVHRNWQSLSPADGDDGVTAKSVAIAGDYRLALQDAQSFCDYLLTLPATPGVHFLDALIAERVLEILEKESIPNDDIREHPLRLGRFLDEKITPILRTVGLTLLELSIQASSTGDKKPRQVAAKAPGYGKDNGKTPQIVEAGDTPRSPSTAEKMPRLYYRVEEGEQIGPMGLDELQRQIDQGVITPRDLLWKQGMNAWQRASEFTELRWAED